MGPLGRASERVRGLGRPSLRARWLAAFAGVLVVLGALAATTTVASRVPSVEVLTNPSDLPGPQPPPISVASASFAPLSSDFVEARLGPNLAAFLPGADTRVEGRRIDATSTTRPGADDATRDDPSPTTTTTMLGPVPSPLPQFSELTVAMGANRTHVDPGEHILYTVGVTNVGTRDFRGDLTITSHHPFWTTDSSTPCGDSGVEPDPDDPCVNPPAPVPGTPSEEVHTVQFSFGGEIEPGESVVRRFRVRVNPGTPSGTEIENHAHMDVVGDGEGPETTESVVVTVR